MSSEVEGPVSPDVQAKADRAKRTIILVAAILMLLPFILVWLTGSVSF